MSKTTVTGSGTGNNGGTIFHSGTVAGDRFNSLDLRTARVKLVPVFNENNSRLGLATRPLGAGNGTYNKMTKGRYIVRQLTAGFIGGVANTTLNTAAGAFGFKGLQKVKTARRLHITSWNAVTGAATKGANAGDAYNFIKTTSSSVMTDTGHSDNPYTSNGKLVFMTTGKVPTTVSYEVIQG